MIKPISDRPWIWIIVAYAAMVAVMAAFVVICVKNAPKEVPVAHSQGAY